MHALVSNFWFAVARRESSASHLSKAAGRETDSSRITDKPDISHLTDDPALTMAIAAVTEAEFGNSAEGQQLARNALKLGHGIDAVETAAQVLATAGNARETTSLVATFISAFPTNCVIFPD